MTAENQNNTIRNRYDRLAFFYDFLEGIPEKLLFAPWRRELLNRVTGEKVLEVGVGTGKNLPLYPRGSKITAIDFSPKMLDRARKRAESMGAIVNLMEMDVQNLKFPDNTFDTVFATFVFCSVPDPVAGLRELRRVCKPYGILLLLEHMRPENPFKGMIFDAVNPLVVRMMGANINRRTIANVHRAGWTIRIEKRLASDVVRYMESNPE